MRGRLVFGRVLFYIYYDIFSLQRVLYTLACTEWVIINFYNIQTRHENQFRIEIQKRFSIKKYLRCGQHNTPNTKKNKKKITPLTTGYWYLYEHTEANESDWV